MELPTNEQLKGISDAITEGLGILESIKNLLLEIKEPNRYKIENVDFLKEEGRIRFNFFWIKLFVRFELIARPHNDEFGRERYHFEFLIIWGRYDLAGGNEIERDIVEDNEACNSSMGLAFSRGDITGFFPRNKNECLQIIDQNIFDCLPESLIHKKT